MSVDGRFGGDQECVQDGDDGPPETLSAASALMRDAARREKPDPAHAAELYKQAILLLLDTGASPLRRDDVRRRLLSAFDRLSLLLRRGGLQAEALEEIDCAASLGLLDGPFQGAKRHREAMARRRDGLQRALASGERVAAR